MEAWERIAVVCGVIVVAAVFAKLVDMRMARRELAPGSATRYRVLRRSIMGAIIFVGVLSALLVIPQVRAIAGGLLASSAIVGLVIGLAAQRTLSNFVAGVMIGLSQPIRLCFPMTPQSSAHRSASKRFTQPTQPFGDDATVIKQEGLFSARRAGGTARDAH